ncbi:hypothetical protein PFBG_04053 [Plasmodium falciparum 7G8]|uniref:Uncharacterized protein n=3 Tax=Plasmodium falciparum TaxID=5833 RepID=A0A024WLJ6_PLAFA|nr:hypothetical protein PFNF135_04168 [Plasmodium falciparum NF135/5.C10]ETW48037.1 hypothetical protein PFMALIP_03902 [Plasmodium falciparum MaliPS096_E11]EUR68088.1 hypothetical protein PFBG_04053 [Plasmodium falciparum 7G8]
MGCLLFLSTQNKMKIDKNISIQEKFNLNTNIRYLWPPRKNNLSFKHYKEYFKCECGIYKCKGSLIYNYLPPHHDYKNINP